MSDKKHESNKVPVPIAVARGDGIGPEIMDAVLGILDAAGASLDITEITVGEKAFEAGHPFGIEDKDWDTLKKSKAFLKAPLMTPSGKGYSSVNVAIRKKMDLFSNVRPCISYDPVIKSMNDKADLVIVRENIEDLYAGIEHRLSDDTAIARKVFTRPEIERIVRFAFEYARANGRKKVTCMAKDNIMKMTDGMFHHVFDEVAKEYADIEKEYYIVDIGSARAASRTDEFDVIVTSNLYGDIISDITAEVTGSVGLGGSGNIGEKFGMFEAIHGTAPDIAGKGLANPSGLLMGAVMMLNYIGQPEVAEKVHNALLVTLEDGIHTGDIYTKESSKQRAGTKDFARAVIDRIGQKPKVLKPADYSVAGGGIHIPQIKSSLVNKDTTLIGMDVYVTYHGDPEALAKTVKPLLGQYAELETILTCRGDKVWPENNPYFETDSMTLRIKFNKTAGFPEKLKKQLSADILKAFSVADNGPDRHEIRHLTQNGNTHDLNFR